MRLLNLTASAISITIAMQTQPTMSMERTEQSVNACSWNETPNEILAMYCPYLDNNSLLSLRATDYNSSQLVDREFRRRADIKTPLSCLTTEDHAHPTPHTMSYFVRQRLWRILKLFLKSPM